MLHKKIISEAILKQRIIKRIRGYSEIFSYSDLEKFNYQELKKLQKSLFIKMQVSLKFRNRKNH